MRIDETADTSKESIVRELRLEEVSELHEEELEDITEDVLRFDFPINYLPVVDSENKVTGVVSFLNLVKGEL